MYNAIRTGSKRHSSQGQSNLLVRSLNASEPSLGNMTQQMQGFSGPGSRNLHLLAKPSRKGDLQKHAFTSRQRFRDFHLPATQSIPAFSRVDDNDESSNNTDLVYYRRSSISRPNFHMKSPSNPFHPYNNLAHPRTLYRFESRLSFSSRLGRTGAKIPTPKTESSSSISSSLSSMDPIKLMKKGMDLTFYLAKSLVSFLVRLPGNTLYYMLNGEQRRAKIAEIKAIAKKEFDHYWTGSKVRSSQNLRMAGKNLSQLTFLSTKSVAFNG